MVTLIVAVPAGVATISWAVVRFKAALVTQRITQLALKECPPAQRAAVLRASAELASKLNAERTTTKPISSSFGRHHGRSLVIAASTEEPQERGNAPYRHLPPMLVVPQHGYLDTRWQTHDFRRYALFVAVAYIRAAASRAGTATRQPCQDLAHHPAHPVP